MADHVNDGIVRCDGCNAHGRRRPGDAAPDFWFYLQSVDRTFGAGGIFIVWACSERCRDKLWQRGPGAASIDERGSQRARDKRRKTTMERFTFWCGWEVPADVPGHHMLSAWPDGMHGWLSGWTGENLDERVYAGRIDAASADEARAKLRSCYGPSADRIRERWKPEQHDLGWRPTGGRFPE